jgi:hypothetical protein
MNRAQEECPRCGASESLLILYGLPTPDMFKQAERGEIVLGGCEECVEEWQCQTCGNEWGSSTPADGWLLGLPSRRSILLGFE